MTLYFPKVSNFCSLHTYYNIWAHSHDLISVQSITLRKYTECNLNVIRTKAIVTSQIKDHMQSLVIAIQVTVEYFYNAVYFSTSRFTLQFNSMDSCDSFYVFKCRQDLKEEIQNDRKSYDSKINEILGKHLSRI